MADDYTQQFQQIIDADPAFQQFRQRWASTPGGLIGRSDPALLSQLDGILQRLFPGGLPKDYNVNPNTGKIAREDYFTRNADWILPAAAGGAVGGFGLLGGFGGGGGGAAAGTTGGTITGKGLGTGAMLMDPAKELTSGGGFPSWLGPSLTAALPLIGRAVGGGPGGGGLGDPGTIPPELTQLLADSMRRMQSQEPLFNAVNRQALAGLPAYAREE